MASIVLAKTATITRINTGQKKAKYLMGGFVVNVRGSDRANAREHPGQALPGTPSSTYAHSIQRTGRGDVGGVTSGEGGWLVLMACFGVRVRPLYESPCVQTIVGGPHPLRIELGGA
jgi:hypothetical protein